MDIDTLLIIVIAAIGLMFIIFRSLNSDTGSPPSSDSDSGDSSTTQGSLGLAIVGLIGLVLTLSFCVWLGTATYEFGKELYTNLSATPACATSQYSHLVWEGWLEPGQAQPVYQIKLAKNQTHIVYKVGLSHNKHPIFAQVAKPGIMSKWAKIPKREKTMHANANGQLRLKVARQDTRTKVKVYILDI